MEKNKLRNIIRESIKGLFEQKKKGLDGKACWDGYKLSGTKMKGGKRVDNCVKMEGYEPLEEHTVTFTPEDMATLHKDGKLTKADNDGKDHTYVFDDIEESLFIIENELDENTGLHEDYCKTCITNGIGYNVLQQLEEKKGKCTPSKGKRFAKRVSGKCRSFGQKGKAKKGGDRIRPGTKKGHAYCARSAKIKKCKNPPCANALSRKKWKCQGSRSVA